MVAEETNQNGCSGTTNSSIETEVVLVDDEDDDVVNKTPTKISRSLSSDVCYCGFVIVCCCFLIPCYVVPY